MNQEKTTVQEVKGRYTVTIPSYYRKFMGISKGDKLVWEYNMENNVVEVRVER
jgi:bifunctional DNA-binding transcriptional regulator/antitoxin component of YhaV-PrlF toxin-antitoxin module